MGGPDGSVIRKEGDEGVTADSVEIEGNQGEDEHKEAKAHSKGEEGAAGAYPNDQSDLATTVVAKNSAPAP